jgi:Nucleotide modification associated domain 5
MRLNKFDKEAFVSSAMNDVPSIDFDAQAQKVVLDHLKTIVPVDVQNIIAKYPQWVESNTVWMPGTLSNFSTRLNAGYGYRDVSEMPELRTKLGELAGKKKVQSDARTVLENKLTATINQFSTLKSALKALPEFAKYLPADRDGVVDRSMPVVANLVTDLMAAGWPKEKNGDTKTNK